MPKTLEIFDLLESNVRSYIRTFPLVVKKAYGSILLDESNHKYLDFLSGAGTLNYGHNNPQIKKSLIQYLESDGLVHGLDMASVTKRDFIEAFDRLILKPRGLNYKLQFCGPTGTNAVEASLKLARIVKQRKSIISFTNAFHGMTLASLSVTSNPYYRNNIPSVLTANTAFMPYCNCTDEASTSLKLIRKFLEDNSSKMDIPAAMIVETIQGEGGVNVASSEWLQGLQAICEEFGIILIIDDIQMGCGRTGEFFSFEKAKIVPDIVLLSKAVGAYGLPMALVLIKPELDQWNPGQHNGTFRGHNLAFFAGTQALNIYWKTDEFSHEIQQKSVLVRKELLRLVKSYPEAELEIRGRGLVFGLESKSDPKLAMKLRQACFKNRLILETCGRNDQVLKLLPALTISESQLRQGLNIIESALAY
ncbi:diaminobutyrate--2-oxoglutarate transaminase [Moorena sp. SIO4G3]|uniref:diaminobutyrate--2-oxoglutarate transaminase n=1 Tax=Moorena sp. SIO4G3 TaxID=2607821 RepID=UPI00142C7828|nr:diaminobutyrate--2-oxoglutarate transaminase [Moorena sp. SIO4G3]NEO78803.1 diaminobutyrate--2-oxoglutarate transaminase [Moorena sp. SIO4G3]